MLIRVLSLTVSALILASGSALAGIKLEPRVSFFSGDEPVFDDSAAEIPAYDKRSKRLFVTNSATDSVDIFDLSDPDNPVFVGAIDVSDFGSPNSVAANPNYWRNEIAVAVDNDQEPGSVVFYDTNGNYINDVTVGALPDMLTYTPWGNKVVVACEGEPNDDYDVDPEGTMAVINLRRGPSRATVKLVDFSVLNDADLPESVRIFGPGATVAQDLEPEYIATDPFGLFAWIVCQENNAVVIADIRRAKILHIFGLGIKDHSLPGNELDPSDRDDGINIGNWPVKAFYQPDAIASYWTYAGLFFVTANEGDARDYDGFSEEERIKDIDLDPTAFPNAAELQEDEALGRLNITLANGDTDGDGDYDELFAYGGRSFSIYGPLGRQVYDSGAEFEEITASLLPEEFNSNNDENDSFESRSDNKGPEPEGVVVGRIGWRSYAFIGLERIGGVMVYDVTNPYAPFFVDYANSRDFSGDAEEGTAGDLGPEGLLFIPAYESPTRKNLLVVTNEVSGTITLFDVVRD